MSDDIRSNTCCPTDAPDGSDSLWGYEVDGTSAHPPPVITCPESFDAWLLAGTYTLPDFSSSILIDGLCALDSDFTVTQNPVAGTVLSIGGSIIILITVTDQHGNSVQCSFTIRVNEPSTPPGTTPVPPTIVPPWVYQPFLFAYWSCNDTACPIGLGDGNPPCWFRKDLTEYFGNPAPRHLTNGGDAVFVPQESPVDGFSPGPTFDRGSMWSNNQANAYCFRADDTDLRLLSTSFTVRFWFKLQSMTDAWNLVGKFNAVGFRVKLAKVGSEYRLSPELKNNTTTLTTTYRIISAGAWIYAAAAFDASTGQLRFYLNGIRVETITSAGFVLAGAADEFRIGQPSSAGPLGDALVCWNLDSSSWLDSVGMRHLTSGGGATLDGSGKINSCMRSNLTANAYLYHADDSALRLTGTDFTIRLWARFTSGIGVWNLVSKINGAGTNGYRLFWNSSDTSLFFRMVNGGITDTLSTLAGAAPTGSFHHIVFTFNTTTKSAKLYVNNVLLVSATFANASPGGTTDQFRIGDISGSFDIRHDEVAIWTSEWDAARVATDYNAGAGTSCVAASSGNAEVYTDEVGIWRSAWNDARVAEDYALMTS